MKKVITGTLALLILIAPILVLSAPPEFSPPKNLDIEKALKTLVNWLFTILLIVAAIFLVIAGFNFVTASGEPDKIAKAKTFVIYALIGVAVAVASRGLIELVRYVMGDG